MLRNHPFTSNPPPPKHPQVIGPRARSLGTGTPRLPFKASDKAESESPARKQHHGLCCRERLMFFSPRLKSIDFFLVRNMKQVLFMESWQLQGMDLGDFWWDWWLKHIETMLTVGCNSDLMALKWEFYGILLRCWMDRTLGMAHFGDDIVWHAGLFI